MGNQNHTPDTTQDTEPTSEAMSKVVPFQQLLIDTGWKVAVSLLAPSFIGIYADAAADTKPRYSVLGMVIGVLLVGALLFKLTKELQAQDKK